MKFTRIFTLAALMLTLVVAPAVAELQWGDTITVDNLDYQITQISSAQQVCLLKGQRYFTGTKLVVPDSVTYEDTKFEVNYIASSAFFGNITLEEVDIAAKNIYGRAFESCANLAKITLREGVTTVSSDAFTKTAITTVHLPASLIELGSSSAPFSQSANLESITIADGNTKFIVKDGALMSADRTTIYLYPRASAEKFLAIPATVTKIAEKAFSYNTNLADTIVLHSGITKANSAFHGATIKCVKIETAAHIYNVFQNGKIEEIILGENVTWLGQLMFKSVENLTKVSVFSSIMPVWEYGVNERYPVFGDTNQYNHECFDAMLYVPYGQKATYAADENKWGCFKNIEEMAEITTSVEAVRTENNKVTKVIRNGQILILRDGVYYTTAGIPVK